MLFFFFFFFFSYSLVPYVWMVNSVGGCGEGWPGKMWCKVELLFFKNLFFSGLVWRMKSLCLIFFYPWRGARRYLIDAPAPPGPGICGFLQVRSNPWAPGPISRVSTEDSLGLGEE